MTAPRDEPPLDVAHVVDTTWLDHAHYLHEAGSTNDAALAHAERSDADESELFVTDRQPSGRGRGANRWWSPRGALAFSILTRRLAVSPDRLSQASLAVGVAVCEALEGFLPVEVRLKWPNDVFAEGRKISGVLIESPGGQRGRLVIGVGVNVNNSASDAPPELRDTAVGMVDLAARSPHEAPNHFSRTAVLAACVAAIGERLTMLECEDPRLADQWRARSLLTGRRVRVELPSGEVAGVVDSIADDGALLVATEAGQRPCYGGVVAEW